MKYVYRHRVSQVVVQKAASSRGGGLGAQRRIPRDCRRAAVFSAPSDAALSTMAVTANRMLERSNRSNLPFAWSSSTRWGVAGAHRVNEESLLIKSNISIAWHYILLG